MLAHPGKIGGYILSKVTDCIQEIDFPEDLPLSDECKDFIIRLLDKNSETRLGTNFIDIVKHPFFASLDFQKLENKEYESPIRPDLSDDILDVSNFD